jgi:hypothetical protein
VLRRSDAVNAKIDYPRIASYESFVDDCNCRTAVIAVAHAGVRSTDAGRGPLRDGSSALSGL